MTAVVVLLHNGPKKFKIAFEFLPPYGFTIYFLLDLMKKLESFGEQD